MEKFDQKEVVSRSITDTFFGLLISSMTALVKKDPQAEARLKESWNRGECNITFQLNGIDMPIKEVCTIWDEQYNQMLAEKALELFKDKRYAAVDSMGQILEKARRELMHRLEQDLGVKFNEEDWR